MISWYLLGIFLGPTDFENNARRAGGSMIFKVQHLWFCILFSVIFFICPGRCSGMSFMNLWNLVGSDDFVFIPLFFFRVFEMTPLVNRLTEIWWSRSGETWHVQCLFWSLLGYRFVIHVWWICNAFWSHVCPPAPALQADPDLKHRVFILLLPKSLIFAIWDPLFLPIHKLIKNHPLSKTHKIRSGPQAPRAC